MAAVGIFTMAAGSAMAFHGGGVAHCDGCHSMHNSPDNPVEGLANTTLLKGSDPSSTCLNCHNGTGSYHINSTDGSNAKEGGDFYWVSNPYSVVVRGNTNTYGGDNAGHNVVAFDFGMLADANPSNAQAPGGTYSATNLGCTSCHDPHGQVLGGTAGGQLPISTSGSYGAAPAAGTIKGNFRLLGDSGYKYETFTYDAPIALANGSNGAYTRYGKGMSEWCANCHTQYLASATKHPVSTVFGATQATNYNSYVATGNFTGSQTTAYEDLVPFEYFNNGLGGINNNLFLTGLLTTPVGPTTNVSQVMCLTCHRAHASAHNNAGRWDFETEYIAESAALESPDVPASAVVYYEDGVAIDIATKFGDYQRSLCNKCHVQD